MIFSVIDIETTGLSPRKHDRILEIGIAKMNASGEIIETFETLFNPHRDVGPTRIHGISASMLTEAPTFEQIASPLLDFIHNTALVAHNAPFDLSFIMYELQRSGITIGEISNICTSDLCRKLVSDAPSFKLSALCEYFEIETRPQRSALADSIETAHLLRSIQDTYAVRIELSEENVFVSPARKKQSQQIELLSSFAIEAAESQRETPLSGILWRLPTVPECVQQDSNLRPTA